MDSNQFKQLLLTIVTSLGGIGVILAAVLAWLGRIWADRIYLKTSVQHEKDIERIKGTSTERRDLINSLLSVIANQRSKSYERILDSIELVWAKTLQIKAQTRDLVFIYKIFSSQDLKEKRIYPTYKISEDTFGELIKTNDGIINEVEKVRPFIGEILWKLFIVYQAFFTRLAWKTIEGKKNERLFPWDKDPDGKRDTHLFGLLSQVFSEAEISSLISTVYPVETIETVLEFKILEEMNQITLGQKFVDHTVEEYIRFAEAAIIQRQDT